MMCFVCFYMQTVKKLAANQKPGKPLTIFHFVSKFSKNISYSVCIYGHIGYHLFLCHIFVLFCIVYILLSQ